MSNAWESMERDRAKVWRRYITYRRAERRVAGMAIYCPVTDDDLEGLLNRLERAESVLRDIAQRKELTRPAMVRMAAEWHSRIGYRNQAAS